MRPVSVLFVGIGHFPPLSSLCPIPTKLRATTKKSPFPAIFYWWCMEKKKKKERKKFQDPAAAF